MNQSKQQRIEITESTPKQLLGVYGTLRVNNGNHRLLEGKSKYLGTYKTEPKYTMQGRHSGFPIVYRGGETAIVYELYEVDDAEVLNRVHSLEGCTGIPGDSRNWYDLEKMTNEEHGEFHMYVQNGNPSEASIIKSGDWEDRRI